MFLIRRAAFRATSVGPSLLLKPRYLTTTTPFITRSKRSALAFSEQRRFASNEAEEKQLNSQEAIDDDSKFPNPTSVTHESDPSPEDLSGVTEENSQDRSGAAEAPEAEKDKKDAISRPAPSTEFKRNPHTTAFLGNLFFEVTEEDLMEELKRFGEIENIKLIRDQRGLSKGFGFVNFKDTESRDRAIRELHDEVFGGRRIIVQPGQNSPQKRRNEAGRPRHPPSNTLFVANLSFEMSDAELNNIFSELRGVTGVRVAIDKRTGQPRGFAHAEFVDVESAVNAKEQLGGKVLYGRDLYLDFAPPRADTSPYGRPHSEHQPRL